MDIKISGIVAILLGTVDLALFITLMVKISKWLMSYWLLNFANFMIFDSYWFLNIDF